MPSGDFARPQGGRKPVKVKPKAKRPAAMLDTLPAKKGGKPKPYTPAPAKQLERKVRAVRKAAPHQVKDTKGDTDRQRAAKFKQTDRYLKDLRVAADARQKPAGSDKGPLRLDRSVRDAKVAPSKSMVDRPRSDAEMRKFLATGGRPTRKGKQQRLDAAPVPVKALKRVVEDYAEIQATTPSNVAKLASTAVTHPKKVPGMLAQPYKDLAKDPVGYFKEHPVGTVAMLAPGARVPGKVAGRVARVAGKQTIKREPATLPGTALKETRSKSRDIAVNAVQTVKDKRAARRGDPAPQVTPRQVERRVDEFYGYTKKHTMRVESAAVRQARERTKGQPKAARKLAVQQHVEGARGGAQRQLDRKFVEEFGSTYHVDPGTGAIVKPKAAGKGVLHASKADAEKIAGRLGPTFVVKEVNGKHAVLPKVAVDRLNRHKVVGTSPAIGAVALRKTRSALTQTVLPLSPKWMTGNVVEAAVRAMVSGAGPTSYLRERRVVKALERQQKGSGKDFEARALPGGYFGGTIRELPRKTYEEELAGSKLANVGKAMTAAGRKPGPKQVHAVWRAVTDFTFNTLNGKIVENTAQRAMLGKALKRSPLMDHKVVGLSDRAVADAVKGLKGTEAQVALGREVQRMYGKYSNFSPAVRETIMHWTPFAPWYGNAVRFLFDVLPKDHPVLMALLADVSAATEDWRKAAGLSTKNGTPAWLLGSYPSGSGMMRIGRYTPFGAISEPVQSLGDALLPQLDSAWSNLKGLDWKGERLKYPGYQGREFSQAERAIAAATSLIESLVPGVGQAARITGVEQRYVFKKDEPSVFQGKPLAPALRKEFDPFKPTAPQGSSSSSKSSTGVQVKVKPVKVAPVKIKPVKVR